MDGWDYIVDCRWRTKLADIRKVYVPHGQIARSAKRPQAPSYPSTAVRTFAADHKAESEQEHYPEEGHIFGAFSMLDLRRLRSRAP
jgi:hypothetical protein